MKIFIACILFLSACSSGATPDTKPLVYSAGQDSGVVSYGDSDAAQIQQEDDAGLVADDAGLVTDAPPPDDSGIDAPTIIILSIDSGLPVPQDAGKDSAPPAPDKIGIWCNTKTLGLVIGCDGTDIPGIGASLNGEVETAQYTCAADGSGTATCNPGEMCQGILTNGGVNTYYPGVCE